MTALSYRVGCEVADFLAWAQRVWPRDYSVADAEAALTRTINIGAWHGARLVRGARDGVSCMIRRRISRSTSSRREGALTQHNAARGCGYATLRAG
jgi:hypothetical protein